jgi:2'-5' RNA ligase
VVQSLELLLDDELDTAVRGQWAALAAAGLPSQARHTGESNRPHVTLTVASSVPDLIEGRLSAVAAGVPLTVRLGGLLCFGARGGSRQVLSRLVVPTPALLAVQATAAALFGDLPGSPANLAAGAWTPHVTLARNLPTERLGAAVAALGHVDDLIGTAEAVRRWDSDSRTTWLIS